MSSKKANRSPLPRLSRLGASWIVVAAALCPVAFGQSCVACHPREAAAFAATGMGRSFSVPAPGSISPAVYYHKASDTYFAIVERGGEYFQRQYQIGFDGKQTAALEKRIDYVLGSGNHSKTYLSRTASNDLIELPLAWYAEKGGSWAMNPGYDRPDHQGFRRRIGDDCMFCHNAYPKNGAFKSDSDVPHGIDCERCHGSGEKHQSNPREPIVNPARLTSARQAEVCGQCHLETTSSPLPNSIVRYERGPFSYQPGQPLADFKLYFDHTPDPKEDRFEVNSSAYRLAMSACALKSDGKLTCTTCHDPHAPQTRDYTPVCRQCHAGDFNALVTANKHTAATDCITCHMPKRRTADVVHLVMTDHYIQRRKPTRDLLADLPEHVENYRGEVVPYSGPADELYTAVAQVIESSNLQPGIERLSAVLQRTKPAQAEPWLQLADALRKDGKCAQALPVYEEGRRRDPASVPVMQRTALCMKPADEVDLLLKASQVKQPEDAVVMTQLGAAYATLGKPAEALAAFRRAVAVDPEQPEAWNDLGGLLTQTGDTARAEDALRNAIRLEPNYAEAHNNLASLLSRTKRFEEARFHFDAALRYRPDYNFARLNYGIALAQVSRFPEAEKQLEAILQSDPNKPDPNAVDAHEALGMILAAEGQPARAIAHYREAVRLRPDFGRANLSLGSALVESGDIAAGLPYLRTAAKDSDPAIRKEAQAILARPR